MLLRLNFLSALFAVPLVGSRVMVIASEEVKSLPTGFSENRLEGGLVDAGALEGDRIQLLLYFLLPLL